MKRRVLFVFAHQDDEMAAASRIRHAIARGDRITCVYLTDGASRVSAAVRDEESRQALRFMSVSDARFVGTREGIADGSLVEQLDRALALLDREIEAVDEVVTLAWEGGHQDHDAAHLIAAVFARRRGVPCFEVPLYTGYHTRGPFFRFGVPVGDGWESRPIPRRELVSNAMLCRFYKSQRSTWLALMPMMLASRPRELTRRADLTRAERRPHRGALLYERRFRYPYPRFASFAEPFLRAHRG